MNEWDLLTDGADDAGVARHRGLRVNVQEAHVLQVSISHGSMQLLGLNEGRTHILRLRHDWTV